MIIYKSVTLGTGEQFILPPGAELIGAESRSDLESTCDLPELDNVGCYTCVIEIKSGTTDPGGFPPNLSNTSLNLKGVATKTGIAAPNVTLFGGTYRLDSFGGLSGSSDSLKAELNTIIQGVFNIQVVEGYTIGTVVDTVGYIYITLKTTAAIANSLFIVSLLGNPIEAESYHPFVDHTTLTGDFLPVCS